jgi:hypothetical protein
MNKWRTDTLQAGLGFNYSQQTLERGIFKFFYWLNGSFFGGDYRDFLKRESRPIWWHQYRILTQFFSSAYL